MSPPYLGFEHWAELESEIGMLLGKINDPFEEADLYCELNPSTHFHVQVGNIGGNGHFKLPTIQRLAILVLAFEKLIDKMLADHMGYITESVSDILYDSDSYAHIVLIECSCGQVHSSSTLPSETYPYPPAAIRS
jgi:hypothetical protein